ncbi:MAG: hypothetical protein AAF824_06200 [Bacteroidota bacterium]
MLRYLTGISICIWVFVACQSSEPAPELKQAFEVHEMALITFDSLTSELDALQALELAPEGQQTLAEIKEASTQWEEGLVEVPGFEHAGHDHAHDHDHSHDHGNEELKDLPPAEMLELQEAMGAEVKRLLKETRTLAAQATQSSL